MFIDSVKVLVCAGNGGNGHVSFRHEKFVDRGGPDGGDGGNGGNVIFKASRNQNTLASFRYQKSIVAEDGQAGSMRKKHGRNGKDSIVEVPVGTTVVNAEGEALFDLIEDNQEVTVSKGGRGGFGNAHFVSSVRQAPRVAEKGEVIDELELRLELKLIADVGLIGLPNAGKSTFLSVVSNARPAIADYPFTTLTPNLGVADIDSSDSILIADIPGIIEGASSGKGLGIAFLKHVERTSVLLHLIDAYDQDIAASYKVIDKELKRYSKELASRPRIVALTKTEGLDDKTKAELVAIAKKVAKTDVYTISSAAQIGTKELLFTLYQLVAKDRANKEAFEESIKTEIPHITLSTKEQDESWTIEIVNRVYVVRGAKIESFARRTNFDSSFGIERLRHIMKKMGIMHELSRKGIKDGDTIDVVGTFPY